MRTASPRAPARSAATTHLALQLTAATYASPGPALRADVIDGAFAGATARLADATGVPAPAIDIRDWRDVQAAHVDLFVASGAGLAAPPYVGLVADGELLGDTERALAALFRREGIAPDAAWRDLPDHVAAVAEAGALLAERGRDAAARTLLRRYLAPWFARYAAAVAASDESGFYGPVTRFLHAAIQEVTREPSAPQP